MTARPGGRRPTGRGRAGGANGRSLTGEEPS
ncbi:hypothetical protein Ae406Ps2_2991c [Pseudonocardia sp. Ae406_Ps2]|nr:hypothetical protein Ae331Ps2_2936 [Pseudonocardia sp. Ae331_Ps2]OLM02991.1 hypothetical protein Ae406Ps2_2991c [Pseudonocardia sp. Ae406_Ps2]OLM12155.1 hypothetical protein Ae505Ps2_2282 [Pseudonocardia sp. Ae505_Ps2]OLM24567.1 hypothetical protein Ae706Ps2_3000c [Pseudonocardia sp. Ae706_Ps2]